MSTDVRTLRMLLWLWAAGCLLNGLVAEMAYGNSPPWLWLWGMGLVVFLVGSNYWYKAMGHDHNGEDL